VARAHHITTTPSGALTAVRPWPRRPRPRQLPRRGRGATCGALAAVPPAPALATRGPRSPGPRRGFPAPPPAGWCYNHFWFGGEPSVYSEQDFEMRPRMPRVVFMRLYAAVHDEPWWRRSVNATGRLQSHSIQKLAAGLRVLGYGEFYDRAGEYCRLSRLTIAEATRRLTRLVVDKWKQTSLRRATDEELKHILSRNATRGMPGCIGFIACTHWQWLKCPKDLDGQYHDRKDESSVVIGSVCDEDIYIWHFSMGRPGATTTRTCWRPPRSFWT